MAAPQALLCIDIGRRTGWAVPRLDHPRPWSGVKHMGEPGADAGSVGEKFNTWLLDMLRAHQPRRVYYETPIIPGHSDFESVFKLYGMSFTVETVCWMNRIEVVRCNNSRIKKFFAGHGRAEKVDMMAECFRRGWSVEDSNEADALAILAFAEHELGVKRDSGKLFAERVG